MAGRIEFDGRKELTQEEQARIAQAADDILEDNVKKILTDLTPEEHTQRRALGPRGGWEARVLASQIKNRKDGRVNNEYRT